MSGQRQTGGEDSTNVQAGRDLIVRVGPTIEEVRAVALDVFKANFLSLRGDAEQVARVRAEKITSDFLAELEARLPDGLDSARDPDMQRSIFNAQRDYACSGDEDLEQVLVDLLVDRAGQKERSIATLVLNEAIVVAPKLTADQRAAIAACFIGRYARYVGPPNVDDFYRLHVSSNLLPLSRGVPTGVTPYQHIEYVGAGSVGIGQMSLESVLRFATGYFTNGFNRDQIPATLADYADNTAVFIPALRDPARLQLAVMYDQDIADFAEQVGDANLAEPMRGLLQAGVMDDEAIKRDVVERVPPMEAFFHTWNTSLLARLQLTTVGIAIGHGYWRRVTGQTAPLMLFIP
jgi:hypothetical protein